MSLRPGIDYKQVEHGSLRFELLKEQWLPVCDLVPRRMRVHLMNGKKHLAEITDHGVLAKKGFRWDGCSPRRRWTKARIRIGTPTTRRNIRASLWHDLLLRCAGIPGFPVSVSRAHDVFDSVLVQDKFRLRHLWVSAVRLFGRGKSEKGDHLLIESRDAFVLPPPDANV